VFGEAVDRFAASYSSIANDTVRLGHFIAFDGSVDGEDDGTLLQWRLIFRYVLPIACNDVNRSGSPS
jgi:hypothetical protein